MAGDKPIPDEPPSEPRKGNESQVAPTQFFAPGSAPDHAPTQGQRLHYFGDYELLSEVARGGMGVVYRARQVSLNRIVALKLILAGNLAGSEEVARFKREAEAAAKLDHPHIVPIYEIGEHDGHHYFSMGFVTGRTLAEELATGPMDPRRAAQLLAQVAAAVEYSHQQGVIHRDLKPANILLDGKGGPRVTDFGLAKRIEGDSELTRSGQILGTPAYMPPEQAAGKLDEVGPRADVYALGAILFAMLTGRPPFQAANPIDTLLQVLHHEPLAPKRVNPSLDRDIETICLKCLQKRPDDRYPTAQALKEDLIRYLERKPIHARRAGLPGRSASFARRNIAVVRYVGAAATLLALLLPALRPGDRASMNFWDVSRVLCLLLMSTSAVTVLGTLAQRTRMVTLVASFALAATCFRLLSLLLQHPPSKLFALFGPPQQLSSTIHWASWGVLAVVQAVVIVPGLVLRRSELTSPPSPGQVIHRFRSVFACSALVLWGIPMMHFLRISNPFSVNDHVYWLIAAGFTCLLIAAAVIVCQAVLFRTQHAEGNRPPLELVVAVAGACSLMILTLIFRRNDSLVAFLYACAVWLPGLVCFEPAILIRSGQIRLNYAARGLAFVIILLCGAALILFTPDCLLFLDDWQADGYPMPDLPMLGFTWLLVMAWSSLTAQIPSQASSETIDATASHAVAHWRLILLGVPVAVLATCAVLWTQALPYRVLVYGAYFSGPDSQKVTQAECDKIGIGMTEDEVWKTMDLEPNSLRLLRRPPEDPLYCRTIVGFHRITILFKNGQVIDKEFVGNPRYP
jgi:serine/threonine protein kinase